MNEFPLDLHLDEDGRFALTEEEQTQRIKDFLSLGREAREFMKKQNKANSEIAILRRRQSKAKKEETRVKLQKLIDEVKMPEFPNYPLMTFSMAVESGIINDIRYSPRENIMPKKDSLASFTHTSKDESDFFFKHIEEIEKLRTFDPSNPPTKYELLLKKQNDYQDRNKIFKNKFFDDEIMPQVSVAGWIRVVSRIAKAVPTLVQFIENEIGIITKNPKLFMNQGMSTVRLLERITKRQIQKEQYLNIFVMVKDFEKQLKNEQERKIFACFFKKTKKANDVWSSSKIRTAYRARGIVVKRLRNFCSLHGYDEKWFADHFGDLPAARKLIINEFQKEFLKEVKDNQDVTLNEKVESPADESTNKVVRESSKIRQVTDEYYAQKDPWVLLTLLGFVKPEQVEKEGVQ